MTVLRLPVQRPAAGGPGKPELTPGEIGRREQAYRAPPSWELLDLYAAILIVVPLVTFLKSLWP